MKFRSKLSGFLAAAVLLTASAGCSSSNKATDVGILGAGAGGVIGGVIGKSQDKTARGVLIGAAVGGAAGAIIGSQMDKQAEELDEELENATVERVGEGIKITFNSNILFAVDSSELNSAAQQNLNDLAGSLGDYENTNILIAGHTDSTGPEEYNQSLSERRAGAAAVYLANQGIAQPRLEIVGHGEMKPIASNDTDVGRQQNRRVEVAIYASEEYRMELEEESG